MNYSLEEVKQALLNKIMIAIANDKFGILENAQTYKVLSDAELSELQKSEIENENSNSGND